VALFVAGFISGAMVTYHKAEPAPWKVGRQKEIAEHIRQRLKNTLNLTPEQAQKIDPYIEKTAEQLEASHVTCLNSICAALDRMHVDIAPELSAEQKQKLEQITAERRDLMLKKYNYAPAPANPVSH
jgi:Spy/CpxP family protein refolding chaperone